MKNNPVLIDIAKKLNVDKNLLWSLIQFESSWKPDAKNPVSSARGLIQFVDSTAKNLGYLNSLDLVTKLPTIELQLKYAVYPYLKQYYPFPTPQSLFMAVFYPAAMFWPENRQFPANVQKNNPGIKTPLDYIRFVYKKLSLRYMSNSIYLGIGVTILYILSKKGKK